MSQNVTLNSWPSPGAAFFRIQPPLGRWRKTHGRAKIHDGESGVLGVLNYLEHCTVRQIIKVRMN